TRSLDVIVCIDYMKILKYEVTTIYNVCKQENLVLLIFLFAGRPRNACLADQCQLDKHFSMVCDSQTIKTHNNFGL
ncbi:MAG: hypothetical protein KAI29_05170, partial [Cyclobacteriaceae bacterium]|nr:hypothetical protein [Cyclobacteriaceae bacterium]